MFTRDCGERIAKKLGAEYERRRKHDIVVIKHGGKRIAQYGLRRGSGNVGHSYIPRQLHVSQSQCRDLRDCPMSAEQYFALMQEKGLL